MNIYEKILAIMQDVKYLAKDDSVEFKNTKYKAITEEKVTSIFRERLIANKLVVFPVAMKSTRSENVTRVEATWRLVNVDDPAEYLDICTTGEGADSQDKGAGKAITYAFKYFFLRTFAVPTGEDPDKISSAELDYIQEREKLISAINSVTDDKERLDKYINAWSAKKYGSSSNVHSIATEGLRELLKDLRRVINK